MEPSPAKEGGDRPLLPGLPQDFVHFLQSNGVPLDAFREGGALSTPATRYVRVCPRGALASSHPAGAARQAAVAEALGLSAVERVAWLHRGEGDAAEWAEVYACDATTNLSRTRAYQEGHLYGVDAASVFAVRCLDPRPGDRVLDLCCAPGAKLCALADAVLPDGEAVGVDVAPHRLAACRNVLRKYAVTNARLSLGDGAVWDPRAAEWLDLGPPPRGRGQRGRKRRRDAAAAAEAAAAHAARGEEPEEQEEAPQESETFDRVLVDAECTHDASLRHVEKFGSQWGWETLSGRVPWVRQEESLYQLQSALLASGFRLLREGGVLVYSTCSLCRSQNEDIISSFLAVETEAVLDPLPLPLQGVPAGTAGAPARPSLLEAPQSPEVPLGGRHRCCSARFDPTASGTSGLFVARLRRRSSQAACPRSEEPEAAT